MLVPHAATRTALVGAQKTQRAEKYATFAKFIDLDATYSYESGQVVIDYMA